MQPTFESGQMLGAVTLFNTENLRRGDLVFRSAIYKDELNIFQKLVNKICSLFTAKLVRPFGNEQRSLTHGAVFRIVGLPGDTIYMNNFIAYIKNAESDNFLNYQNKTMTLKLCSYLKAGKTLCLFQAQPKSLFWANTSFFC